MIGPTSHIGAIFARRREHLKLTQADLAARLGKSQTYIARIEGGKRDPQWATVLEISRALELEPALIPRQSLPAVQAVLQLTASDEIPPLAGDTW